MAECLKEYHSLGLLPMVTCRISKVKSTGATEQCGIQSCDSHSSGGTDCHSFGTLQLSWLPRKAPMTIGQRHLRLGFLEALERWAKQFRSHQDLWPFRVPHDPLPLEDIIRESLGDEGWLDAAALRARSVLQMEFHDGAAWEAWVIALPSGIMLYCDSDDDETRVLAS